MIRCMIWRSAARRGLAGGRPARCTRRMRRALARTLRGSSPPAAVSCWGCIGGGTPPIMMPWPVIPSSRHSRRRQRLEVNMGYYNTIATLCAAMVLQSPMFTEAD